MNLEVRQVADPVYANARGAAWIAAVGMKVLAFSDIPTLVKIRKTYSPDARNRLVYDDGFENFQLIYARMKDIYRRMNQ